MKEIKSLQHPLVKHLCKLQKDAKFRKSEGRVLLEGKNCIQDVCKSRPIMRLLVTSAELIPEDIVAHEIIFVSPSIIKKISGVQSPEGIIAEIEMPKMQPLRAASKIVALDRIQDPGNLGTILRSALAFGWDGVFLLAGTVDPFNDKALRAAKGATFEIPIYSGNWKELERLAGENGLSILVADLVGKRPEELKHDHIVLVLGNEAQGVNIPSNLGVSQVCLPMSGPMESLNVAVAGSILMYLFR